ncbi:hypothetical protein LEP1GSC017_3485 [Leptospira meyeri serovar Hardjo str. Went 5]|nr:hypothetical protein LEP1GSC017_3485 [Leptospira meyeri serovar Hardjo str. Went 5]EMJ86828.1 hypothetical protein LEP1GSC196_3431 [Leptospira meyeri serovar Semaranga str. Veldrot Semarang 173]
MFPLSPWTQPWKRTVAEEWEGLDCDGSKLGVMDGFFCLPVQFSLKF